MNIHEYQAKKLLEQYGVSVLKGGVAFSVDEAMKAAQNLDAKVWVVKAQIHAGGRGKGGGVKVVKSLDEVRSESMRMLGMNLVTHQTGPEGQKVRRLYIEQGCAIKKEFYLGMLVDRAACAVTIMASTEGGMDIEEVAAKTPDKILKIAVDPKIGCEDFYARQIAFGLGLSGKAYKQCIKFVKSMYKAFIELDASIVEINPLVLTEDDEIVALDAKMNFDDNALYRQADIADLRDESEEDPKEIEATKNQLNYVALDGTVGCMVNGAGLAMATMDIVKLAGQKPANFLDVGGGATKERVTAAFKIILSDENVNAILVNIFGGIMRCDIIAGGIVAAAKEVSLDVPLVVRLAGTNVDLGKKILAESGLPIISADNLGDAAEKIAQAVRA